MTVPAKTPTRTILLLLLAVNLGLAGYFGLAHVIKSFHIYDWKPFFAFEGQSPFQSRILLFAVGKGLFKVIGYSSSKAKLFFLIMDVASALTAVTFTTLTVKRIYPSVALQAIAIMLFWQQLYFVFIVSLNHNYYYVYDLFSVAITAAGLFLIISKKPFWQLLLLVIIGMFNRETAILIPAFYLAYRWDDRRQIFLRAALPLFLICIAIKLFIAHVLVPSGNSIELYSKPGYLRLFYNFAFLSIKHWDPWTLNCVAASGFLWLLLLLNRHLDAALRRLLIPMALFFLGMTLVGNLSELRIFGEFIPVLTLMLTALFQRFALQPARG